MIVPFLSVSAAFSRSIKSSLFFMSEMPSFSSSRFRHPSLLWSKLLKTSFRWMISFGLRWTAIAVRAAYFNFKWCWNFFNESIFILFSFFATTPYLLLCLIHSCLRASSAVSRLSGLQISLRIRSLAESETSSHSSPSNSNSVFMTAVKISLSSSP